MIKSIFNRNNSSFYSYLDCVLRILITNQIEYKLVVENDDNIIIEIRLNPNFPAIYSDEIQIMRDNTGNVKTYIRSYLLHKHSNIPAYKYRNDFIALINTIELEDGTNIHPFYESLVYHELGFEMSFINNIIDNSDSESFNDYCNLISVSLNKYKNFILNNSVLLENFAKIIHRSN